MNTVSRSHVASIDVDAQKGFSDICPNELPVPGALLIVKELNEQADYAKCRIGTKDAHPTMPFWLASKEHPVLSKLGMPDADVYWPSHCVNGTTGGESLPGLPNPEEYDFFVWKGMENHLHPYGACYHDLHDKLSTGLIEYLRANGITHVIVGGLAEDYCCRTTGIQLLKGGFNIFWNAKAMRGLSEESCKKTRVEIQELGGIVLNDTLDLKQYVKL